MAPLVLSADISARVLLDIFNADVTKLVELVTKNDIPRSRFGENIEAALLLMARLLQQCPKLNEHTAPGSGSDMARPQVGHSPGAATAP
jgi:hypothetical protein